MSITYRQIARSRPAGLSTIACLACRAGAHRPAELEQARPDNRYECGQPSDLLHLDIKKLGRLNPSDGTGWVHPHRHR